jgi:hypothetical protein
MSGYSFYCTPCGFAHAGECPPAPKKTLVQKTVEEVDGKPSAPAAGTPLPNNGTMIVIPVGSRWLFEHQDQWSTVWKSAGWKDGYEVMAIVANGKGGAAIQVREWNSPAHPIYTCRIEWWDPDGIAASDGGKNRFVVWP